MTGPAASFDYLLVGGGLAGGLTALALVTQRPGARLALIESGRALGGNHTWSFHGSDVDENGAQLLAPLVARRWSGYDVRFPSGGRHFDGAYASITSEQFDRVVRARLATAGAVLLEGVPAVEVDAHEAVLADGRQLRAEVVIDARGPAPSPRAGSGYQKFLGLEVELDDDDPVPGLPPRPLLMDATVEQVDGYRFVYVLPQGPRRALIEDTVFSSHPTFDEAAIRARLARYLVAHGLGHARVVREERGVLPMPWRAADGAAPGGPLRAGYAGGWAHPATGYSVPLAVRFAAVVARESPRHLADALEDLRGLFTHNLAFYHLLNRLLFTAMPPDLRWVVLARFFSLPAATIERFFRLETTGADRVRILLGRPPPGISWRAVLSTKEAS